MKKLKKSLLVVPALGVLMLAAAGSVGGTVAWFSSVSTFDTQVSEFAVGRVAGNLSVTMTPDTNRGTMAGKSANSVVVGKVAQGDVNLTHGSFNHAVAIGETSVYTISNQTVTQDTTSANMFDGGITLVQDTFLTKAKQIEGDYTFTSVSNGTSFTLGGLLDGEDSISADDLADEWGITPSVAVPTGKIIKLSIDNTYVNAGENWNYSANAINEKYWFYAVHWTMEFSYDFGADTAPRNVYLNTDNLNTNTAKTKITFNPAAGQTTKTEKTAYGFRLAFKAGDRALVWAPEQANGDPEDVLDIHYVNNVNNAVDYSESANLNVIYKNKSVGEGGYVTESATSGKQANGTLAQNYICQLTNTTPGTTNRKTVDCVAWFEGTDPNIFNAAEMDVVTASLSFFCVQHSA